MIYTSSHSAIKVSLCLKTYAISGNRGKDANYHGLCYPELAPKKEFWQVWHDNIGVISEEENNRYYVKEYWNQVLLYLDPEKLYKELDNSVLLCYEKNIEFCHRHIVSAWFELLLGKPVPEIIVTRRGIKYVSRPKYIKEYLYSEIFKLHPMLPKGYNMWDRAQLRKFEAELLKGKKIDWDI